MNIHDHFRSVFIVGATRKSRVVDDLSELRVNPVIVKVFA